MSHQGNIYLSFNLVLLVRFSREYDKAKQESIAGVIAKQIEEHLQARFNKKSITEKRNSTVKRAIRETLLPRVTIDWLSPQQLMLISKHTPESDEWIKCNIKRRQSDQIGHVHVWLYWEPDRGEGNLEYDIEVGLRGTDPEIRVEPFHIGREKRYLPDSADNGSRPDKDDVYHLSSRVCAAFVEYVSDFLPVSRNGRAALDELPSGILLPTDQCCVLRGIDPVAYEKRNPPAPLDPCQVVKKILDVRDAVDLVCSGLDGSMQYFPPVPHHMQTIFEGKDNQNPNVHCRYKFPFVFGSMARPSLL